MERENYRFNITPLGGQLAKEDRIRRLIPDFEAGRIWFPESLHYTQHTKEVRNMVNDFIEEEFAPFPVGLHDDMMDCLARIIDPPLGTQFPKEAATRPVARVRAPSSSAWMGG